MELTELPALTCNQSFQGEQARRIDALLGLPPKPWAIGDALPAGWHFPLLGSEPQHAWSRADGFAGLGVALPEIDLPRLVAGGRRVQFDAPVRIGMPLFRSSVIASVTQKEGAAGPIVIMKTRHEIGEAGERAAIREEQTYLFLSSPYADSEQSPAEIPVTATQLRTVTPDETMLFRFSALSFNSHRIHLDRDYARDVEGYPDLVVNGGLTTLLMTEVVRSEMDLAITSLAVTNRAPLFCGRPMTFFGIRTEVGGRILALDDRGALAAEMEFTANGN